MSIAWLQRCRWPLSLLVVGLIQRLTPWARADDIEWFRLNGLPEWSTGVEVDGSTESDRISGGSSTYNTLFITPTIGMRTSGSIYHPNLLSFDADGELGWGWDQMTTSGSGINQNINESQQLLRYLVDVSLLQEKPYNASFLASEDHTYRDYGSFDTYKVDSERYEGRINWNTAAFSINTDFGYTDETDTGLVDSSEVAETYFNFLGINKRQSGQTSVVASWEQFDNILNLGNDLTTMNEALGISDSETFGSRRQTTASTGVSVSHAEYSGQQLDTLNANENVETKQSRTLDTFLIFGFEQSDLHPATDSYFQGQTGVRHQLFDSLTSTLDAHGDYQENDAPGGSSTSDLYGLGLSENYQKRVQKWGRLTINASVVADHQDDTSTGDTYASIAESHQLYLPTSPQYRPVYLNRPNVIASSVQVTAGGQLLNEGSDFELVTSGQLTEVRLIAPPSSHLQSILGASDNLAVSVNYESESNNNASYESLTSDIEIRMEILGHIGVYGRLNWLDNDAPPSVVTQTLTDLTGGVDYHWRWFRTGAEYEDFDSNFSQYTAFRFLQDFDFQLDRRSSLSVSLNETFYHYNQDGDQTLYQLTTRYSANLWSSLSGYIQGGAAAQDEQGGSGLSGSAQVGLNWTRGKLSLRTGYEYNDQSTTAGKFTQDLSKNRVFAYLKRSF